MLAWKKNHWVIHRFHYSERWTMVLSGLKFHDFIRQNEPMPLLAAVWCDQSGSVGQAKRWVLRSPKLAPGGCAPACSHGRTPMLLQRTKGLVFQKQTWFVHSEIIPQPETKPSKWRQPDPPPKIPLDSNRSMQQAYSLMSWRTVKVGCKRWAEITKMTRMF